MSLDHRMNAALHSLHRAVSNAHSTAVTQVDADKPEHAASAISGLALALDWSFRSREELAKLLANACAVYAESYPSMTAVQVASAMSVKGDQLELVQKHIDRRPKVAPAKVVDIRTWKAKRA